MVRVHPNILLFLFKIRNIFTSYNEVGNLKGVYYAVQC